MLGWVVGEELGGKGSSYRPELCQEMELLPDLWSLYDPPTPLLMPPPATPLLSPSIPCALNGESQVLAQRLSSPSWNQMPSVLPPAFWCISI